MSVELAVVGGGRMGSALVAGLISSGWQPGAILVVEQAPGRREQLATELPGVEVVGGVDSLAEEPAGVVLAVKPTDARDACQVAAALGARRVLSVMAGVHVDDLTSWLGGSVQVVRAMPNTPALVRAGVSAIAGSPNCGEECLEWAEQVLGAVGRVVRVSEPALDAVTGLSGSGPAYLFLVTEALVEAGVLNGLSRPLALTLAAETLAGSARLLLETGEDPATLRAQVTSPGGTTAAGLRVLEAQAVRSAFIEAVSAATERSRQLG